MCHKKRTKHLTTNLSHNNHNLLHSDKSTYTTNNGSNAYFYNNKHRCKLSLRFSDWLKSVHYSINELRWTSRNRALDKAVIPTQSSRKTSSYDRIAGRQKNIIPLMFSALALLVVVSMLVCPIGRGLGLGGAESAYAAEANPDFSISLSLGSNVQSEQQLDHGIVGYIENTFTVSSKSTESYSVYLQPAEGSTSNLVGSTYKQEILGVGSNIAVGSFPNNTWGYGISDTNNTTIANSELAYSTIPNGSTPIKTVTKPDDGDDKYKLAFAAKIGDDKPVDHYQSQVLLSVTASAKTTTTYSITYNGNGNTGGATPTTQTASTTESSHTFQAASAGTLVKDGYSFQGWAKNASSSTVNYAAGSNITLTQDLPMLTLYAVWKSNVPVPVYTWSELQYMQQMTSEACADGNATGKQLIDSRDGKSYWVAKLKDGNCWMTQNLNLDLWNETKNEAVVLKTTDSDVTSNWTSSTGASDLWSDTDKDTVKYYDPGDKYCANNTTNECNLTTSQNNGHDHQGNYYSWVAATAGTGRGKYSGDVTGSICPKGWQLPISNNSYTKSFENLTRGTSSSALLTSPYYFVYGGYVGSGSLNAAGSNGFYWSSTAGQNAIAYGLHFNSSGISPSNNESRYVGRSVRCVAK